MSDPAIGDTILYTYGGRYNPEPVTCVGLILDIPMPNVADLVVFVNATGANFPDTLFLQRVPYSPNYPAIGTWRQR